MRLSVVVLALALTFSYVGAEEETPSVYGPGVRAGETVAIGELLAQPDRYVDKIIRVEGIITDVCPMAGCWIEIASDAGDSRSVRFKVKDGEMVFDVDLRGRRTVAEGTFRKITLTKEQAIEYARHLADERGADFDPETSPMPTTIYRIEGIGAVVH